MINAKGSMLNDHCSMTVRGTMDKMRVMLVDDEEGFLSTTKKLLERKGFM